MTLEALDVLVGTWTTVATHVAMPGVTLRGETRFHWLEGAKFLIQRAHCDHPDIPDAMSVLGFMDADRVEETDAPRSQLRMHYYDTRGVFRTFDMTIDNTTWAFSNDAPGFSQRFRGTISDDGATIEGTWELCKDGVHWNKDVEITYRRATERS
jgi:hypothetical protein